MSGGLPPRIMGVLNVTPDSFSDGGRYPSVADAVAEGVLQWENGAWIVDVGGESTRPGAKPVGTDEELRRVLPVIEALVSAGVRISIDTRKAAVAQAALNLGAEMVNDVSALDDPEMARVVADSGCSVCLMHMQGEPGTMQDRPTYRDVVQEVAVFLLQRAKLAEKLGISSSAIFIDPGIGFGKTDSHNLSLIKHLRSLTELGYPVVIGVSRKGFLGRLSGQNGESAALADRVAGALAVHAYAADHGVSMVRTHDVAETRRYFAVREAIERG